MYPPQGYALLRHRTASGLASRSHDANVVPIVAGGNKSSKIVKGANSKVCPGAPHGLTATMQDQFNNWHS
jgi:non-heme chloroperoxidase